MADTDSYDRMFRTHKACCIAARKAHKPAYFGHLPPAKCAKCVKDAIERFRALGFPEEILPTVGFEGGRKVVYRD